MSQKGSPRLRILEDPYKSQGNDHLKKGGVLRILMKMKDPYQCQLRIRKILHFGNRSRINFVKSYNRDFNGEALTRSRINVLLLQWVSIQYSHFLLKPSACSKVGTQYWSYLMISGCFYPTNSIRRRPWRHRLDFRVPGTRQGLRGLELVLHRWSGNWRALQHCWRWCEFSQCFSLRFIGLHLNP